MAVYKKNCTETGNWPLQNAHICNRAHHTVDVKLSALPATMPGRLQAVAVCAIAWQQALPEAPVETDSAYSGALKPASLWRFDNRAKGITAEHQALHHKFWPPTRKKDEQSLKRNAIARPENKQRGTLASINKRFVDSKGHSQ